MQGKEERPKKCTTSIKTYKFNSAHLIVVKLMVNGGLPKNKKNNFERHWAIVLRPLGLLAMAMVDY